jgi:hypothetical protein
LNLTGKARDPVVLQNLTEAMRSPNSDRGEIRKQARAALGALKGQATKQESSDFENSSLLLLRNKLADLGLGAVSGEWDEVEQVYLALAAVNRAYHDNLVHNNKLPTDRDAQIDGAVGKLGQKLAIPKGQNSPAGYRRAPEWEAELKALFEQIRKGEVDR